MVQAVLVAQEMYDGEVSAQVSWEVLAVLWG